LLLKSLTDNLMQSGCSERGAWLLLACSYPSGIFIIIIIIISVVYFYLSLSDWPAVSQFD